MEDAFSGPIGKLQVVFYVCAQLHLLSLLDFGPHLIKDAKFQRNFLGGGELSLVFKKLSIRIMKCTGNKAKSSQKRSSTLQREDQK